MLSYDVASIGQGNDARHVIDRVSRYQPSCTGLASYDAASGFKPFMSSNHAVSVLQPVPNCRTRCVVDECTKDEQYVEPGADGYSCIHRCAPALGDTDPDHLSGSKKLSTQCDPATFKCPAGFTRFGTGDKMGCVVMGCDNGTMVQVGSNNPEPKTQNPKH